VLQLAEKHTPPFPPMPPVPPSPPLQFWPRLHEVVIEISPYESFEEFKNITIDVLKKHPLAEYIAERVYQSSKNPNVRDCVRIASICKTEEDVLRVLRNVKRGERKQ
jgi:hypothetical protein